MKRYRLTNKWSIAYYNASDLDLRATELWGKASFIGYFPTSEGKSIGLYSLDGFYVELYYDGFEGAIKDLKAISIDEALEKYIDKLYGEEK